MQINILSIGKFPARDPTIELFNRYQQWTKFATVNLIEIATKPNPALSIAQQEALEAKSLLEKVSQGSKLIVLDERGKNFSTLELYQTFNQYLLDSVKTVDLIIGGANGLAEQVRQKADIVLSLSNMVFPHLLVRVIIMEQLYRVHTLLQHHPYHK